MPKKKRKVTITVDAPKKRNPFVVVVMKKATRKHKNRKRLILEKIED